MRSNRWPLILTAWALLFTGLSNAHAHVHLCFDGQEAPAAVHWLEDGHPTTGHHEDDAEHADVDVDVPTPALSKSLKHDAAAAIGAAPSFGHLYIRAPSPPTARTPSLERRAPPAYHVPPLRGPPA